MLHLIVLARLPVMAVGAVLGAYALGSLYLRLVWRVLSRRVARSATQ